VMRAIGSREESREGDQEPRRRSCDTINLAATAKRDTTIVSLDR
jgi:hypothetical protein